MQLESAQTDLNGPLPQTGTSPSKHSDQAPQPREGLPAAFKMRRERHYVEQLMGEAPLRTVREIPVAEIEPPDAGSGDRDLEELRQSIRDVGILQPLLVSEAPGGSRGEQDARDAGSRFIVIAGASRYHVATQLALRTVPCIVVEPTPTHGVEALREAAARRAAPIASPEPPMTAPSPELRPSAPASGLRDVTARLAFVSAVMPALDVAGDDPLRWSILTDLMKVEMERARTTAAALEWLSATRTRLVRETVDAASMVDAVLDAVGSEARLLGVKLDVASTVNGYRIAVDRALIVRALIGVVQEMLALSPAGSTLRIDFTGPAIRPALIVNVRQEDCRIPEDAVERFFDPEFARHPNGLTGALVLAAAAHVARLHGGRVHARATETAGCTATVVIPKPLSEP